MDIKLKSNRKMGLLIAGIVTALFAGGFMALYPVFEEKAQGYERDKLKSDEFLQSLYCSNYVLYKDMIEKVEQTNYSYADLYLDKEVSTLANDFAVDVSNYVEEDIDAFVGQVEKETEAVMQNWERQTRYEVTQDMDYCVVDHGTGESIKNTGRNIEALTEEGKAAEQVKSLYEYYVIASFDGAGHLEQVAVKHTEPDVLLKSVQHVMMGKVRDNPLGTVSYLMDGWGLYYGYSENETCQKSVEFRMGAPKNVTFVYALTQEQKDLMLQRSGNSTSNWDEWYAYYQAGTADVYRIFLVILTIVIAIAMNYKEYELHHSKLVRIPLEAGVTLGIVLMAAFGEVVIGLVSDTNRGYFSLKYEQYMPFWPTNLSLVLTGLINFVFLFLLFGCWVYVVNGFGEIGTLGIRGFLKERSILVKWWIRFWNFCKRMYHGFKEEIIHADLGREAGKTLFKIVAANFVVLAIMCSIWIFGWITLLIYSIVLYCVLKCYIHKIQEQYQKLLKATESIAEGNLNTVFDEDLGVFESYKDKLYQIQQGFRKAVDEEVKSQRMKTELITNVSHDLKTPLTAITTYIDLLKGENITEEQRKEYIRVLEKKSLRLKTLIEDLFEVSKANSRNVTVQLVDVDICNLLRQVYLEHEDRIEDANLIFRFRMPEEKVILRLDSQKTYRIFENLYTNSIKYAMPGSRVYVDVEREEKGVRIELKNMSAVELHVEAEELTERFVRGDSSRNTEGSGLGLAIAKSFAEVQGGKLEICVDGDLFKVTIWFV